MEMCFPDTFSVVTLRVRETEKALLQEVTDIMSQSFFCRGAQI